MKTKTDDYLEEILERFDDEYDYPLVFNYEENEDGGWGTEDQRKRVKDFISKEFREYAKNLNEDKNNRFHF